jgi:ribosome-associated protein
MLKISNTVEIPEHDIEMIAIRAQGPGGQHVNKVASAIHLRFDVRGSSLPDFYKAQLLKLSDQRITKEGVIIIKAQQFRTQEQNREDALNRLKALIQSTVVQRKKRKPTRPGKAAEKRRLDAKTRKGQIKKMRRPVSGDD